MVTLGGRRPDLCVRCPSSPASTYQHWLEKEKGEKEKDVPSGGRLGPQRLGLFFRATERSEGGSRRFEKPGVEQLCDGTALAPPTLRHNECVQVAVSQIF